MPSRIRAFAPIDSPVHGKVADMAQTPSPAVVQAETPSGPLATEPAMTIGQLMANKVLLANVITAAIALIALTGFAVPASWDSNQIAANISTVVPVISLLFMTANTYIRQLRQAKDTREAVFSPATMTKLATLSAETGAPVVVPPPADVVLSPNPPVARG